MLLGANLVVSRSHMLFGADKLARLKEVNAKEAKLEKAMQNSVGEAAGLCFPILSQH